MKWGDTLRADEKGLTGRYSVLTVSLRRYSRSLVLLSELLATTRRRTSSMERRPSGLGPCEA